jgi:hypothetical protein
MTMTSVFARLAMGKRRRLSNGLRQARPTHSRELINIAIRGAIEYLDNSNKLINIK